MARGLRRLGLHAAGAVAIALAGGCADLLGADDFVDAPAAGPPGCTVSVEPLLQASVERVDMLFVIDDSSDMGPKQALLAERVPALIHELTNPPCIDSAGVPTPMQPASAVDSCPPESERAYRPVTDLHVGVITSSLGGHGSSACADPGQDDRGRLLYAGSDAVSTYEDYGFLAFDPEGKLEPPGESDSGVVGAALATMVTGAGEGGCAFEAPLESFYRFLVDPEPYDTLDASGGVVEPKGTDTLLLKQRKDFLRADSLLVIAVLTDENDCSLADTALNYRIFDPAQEMPRGRIECQSDPADPCCKPCTAPQEGCPDDPTCVFPLSPAEDPPALRCFDQKRRFGVDFLYGVDRYVDGLTRPFVPARDGELVANPIFSELDPNGGAKFIRDPALVVFIGVVGVPWMDIARRKNGAPHLVAGLDANGIPVGGFMTWTELEDSQTWEVILGEPATGVPPTDPFMVESIGPREGTNPITGTEITLPGGAANVINGHEHTQPDALQYACVFALDEPKNCSSDPSCACHDASDSPLCAPNPDDGGEPTLQVRSGAVPGRRILSVVRGVGASAGASVASICPAQHNDENAKDYGYHPLALGVAEQFQRAGPNCFPRKLDVGADHRVPCTLVEGRSVEVLPDDCTCDPSAAREPVGDEALLAAVVARAAASLNCFCAVLQPEGDDLEACQNDVSEVVMNGLGEPVHGWCYIDTSLTPPLGNPDIVAACPANERRIVRLVGNGNPVPGGSLLLACRTSDPPGCVAP